MTAYACRISLENLGAIASEQPGFDKDLTMKWLEEHGSGYFLRDPSSIFDCRYFEDTVFHQLYAFERGDENSMFRIVRKL